MQVSTIYDGTLITGVVVTRSTYFLEVAITSPYASLSTSRHISAYARNSQRFEGEFLMQQSASILVELYELANKCLT